MYSVRMVTVAGLASCEESGPLPPGVTGTLDDLHALGWPG